LRPADSTRLARARYLTVGKSQPNDTWRVVADMSSTAPSQTLDGAIQWHGTSRP